MKKQRVRKAREWWIVVNYKNELVMRRFEDGSMDANFKNHLDASEVSQQANHKLGHRKTRVVKVRELLPTKKRRAK